MSEAPKPAEILFPLGEQYKLDNGSTVEVRKWSIETTVRVSQRIPRAMEKLMAAKASDGEGPSPLLALLPVMLDEVKLVVAESIGWEPDRVDRECTAEDLLGLSLLVWDHCLAGLLAKLLGLTQRLNRLGAAPAGSSTQPMTKTVPSSKL